MNPLILLQSLFAFFQKFMKMLTKGTDTRVCKVKGKYTFVSKNSLPN